MKLNKFTIIISLLMATMLLTSCTGLNLPKGTDDVKPDVSGTPGVGIGNTTNAEDEFVFVANETDKLPDSKATPAKSTKSVTLYLGDNQYISITLPSDVETITDFRKYVYGRDGSFNVSVLSGIEESVFSTVASIHDAESVDAYTLKSKDGTKGPQEFAKYIDGNKAIVVRVYDAPVTFATLFADVDSIDPFTFINGIPSYEYVAPTGDEEQINQFGYEVKEFASIPSIVATNDYKLTPGFINTNFKVYAFDDGSVTMSKEYRRFDNAVTIYENNLVAAVNGISSKSVYSVYNDGKFYYAELGDFTACVIRENLNTSVCLFGVGDDARDNILTYLNT